MNEIKAGEETICLLSDYCNQSPVGTCKISVAGDKEEI